MEFKRHIPYDILIRPTPNQGFIVEVGCVKLVYSAITNLIKDLTEYLENPAEVEKQYNDDLVKLGRVHIGACAPYFGASVFDRGAEQMESLHVDPTRILHPDRQEKES